ncbi:hypothetical protein [Vibrio sp. YIC-376]|uniref:hypothetical protein n=1 Tax=Vibrio sp. YIC-376 TaxID=3136162 RepID=UPI00402AC6C3
MNEALDFLSSEDVRKVITWLAGGIATIISALWVAFKFFITKRDKSPNDERTNKGSIHIVSADNKGVAIGRDQHNGLKGIYVVIIIALICMVIFASFSEIGKNVISNILGNKEKIESYSLNIPCYWYGEESYSINEKEFNDINEFFEFSMYNSGAVIYLSLTLTKQCNACGCMRADQDNLPDNYLDWRENKNFWAILEVDPIYVLEHRKNNLNQYYKEELINGLVLALYSSDYAVGHFISIPRYRYLNDQHYEYETNSDFYFSVNGLFKVLYSFPTGSRSVILETITPTPIQLKQLKCMRIMKDITKDQNIGFWKKLYLGC